MQVQVTTDKHIEGGERLNRYVESVLRDALGRFENRTTRVIVHFSDENSSKKSGDRDHRCAIEARLANLEPIGVTHNAPELDLALQGAVEKLEKTLERTIGRRNDSRGRTSAAGE